MSIQVDWVDGSYVWAGDPDGENPDESPDGKRSLGVVFNPELVLEEAETLSLTLITTVGTCWLKLRTDESVAWDEVEGIEFSNSELTHEFSSDSAGVLMGLLTWQSDNAPGLVKMTFNSDAIATMDLAA